MSIHEVNSHSFDFEIAAEQAAMDKLMDIHKDWSLKHGFVRFEPKDPSKDRLREYLLFAVLHEHFTNIDGILLTQRAAGIAFDCAILSSTSYRLPQKIPRQEIYTLLIKHGFIQGITVLDIEQKKHPAISVGVDFKNSTTYETVDIVVQEMLSIYKGKTDLRIPVYGLSGSLYWPDEMTYREVQKFVGDRRTNGA